MSHQLLKKVVSSFTLILLSTIAASAQMPAQSQPARATELREGQRAAGNLIESIKGGELSEVAKDLFAGTSADALDQEGGLALCWAVRVNRRDMVDLLLEKGADVNKEEDDGTAALDVAAAAGRANLVKLLLSRGAVVDHKDRGGHTALVVAAIGAMVTGAPAFMFKGMWGGEPNEKGEQLLSNIGNEHKTVIELLLQAHADPNLQADDCGLTALMVAAMSGKVELVQLLLSQGAKIDLKSGDYDALGLAEAFESPDVMAELWETEDSETAQALASWSQITAPGRRAVAKLLRAAGARQ